MAYALFYAMEVEVRSHLTPSKAGRMTDGTTELLTTAVLESDDVLFHWSMFGTDMDTGVGMELLKIIVQLYITIRGFSFANSYVELFKQRTKKILQKGKGLRNELFTSSTSQLLLKKKRIYVQIITELIMIKTKILLFGCFPSFWKRLGRPVFRSAGTGSAISSHIRTHAMNDMESLNVLK